MELDLSAGVGSDARLPYVPLRSASESDAMDTKLDDAPVVMEESDEEVRVLKAVLLCV